MIKIVNNTLVAYILLSVLKLCHLISHSETAMKINIDISSGYNALAAHSTSFSNDNFIDFSLFNLITRGDVTSLLVVSNNDTIIELSIENMKIVNIYKTDYCSHLPKYQCEDSVTINVLSEIDLFEQNMFWFCYVPLHIYYPSPMLSHCILPKNKVMTQDLTWTKKGYSSTSHSDNTFVIKAKPFVFIGSNQQNSLTIIRTKLPNYDGHIDSNDDLSTPIAEFYFERNSRFLEAFQTKHEVYYVVQEPIEAKFHSISECVSSSDTKTVTNTRLLKICKNDPGSAYHDNERNFGTAAKADIVCRVGTTSEPYYYTRSISASWSGDKLYILFDSQKNAPTGMIVCVYDLFSFNSAFNSDMIQPKMFSTNEKSNQRINKPIEDLCRKITEHSLNDTEREQASTMSINGLYRSKNVMPIRSVPVLKLGNMGYRDISTFQLNKFDTTTVIVLIAKNYLRIVTHVTDFSVCHLQDLRFQPNEIINRVKGIEIKTEVFVLIATSKRMINLRLSSCGQFFYMSSCLTNAPNICGWDVRQKKCTLITEEVDVTLWQRSRCGQVITVSDQWGVAEKCLIQKHQEVLSCSCRYCLQDSGCSDGQRVNITDCTNIGANESYDNWSTWSTCYSMLKYQKRTRHCKGKKCTGAKFDYRKCSETSLSETTTNWTSWYKSETNDYSISFRAKCPKNQLQLPVIEERHKLCRNTCLDSSLKWSFWSECLESNIQYRLLNCSSFDKCPRTRAEVKSCPLPSRKYQYVKDPSRSAKYSAIHLVLATLITSLVWLIILILVSVILFRYNYHYQKKSNRKLSSKITKLHTGQMQASYYKPYFNMPQKSILSETSNEYLSSGFTSPIPNPDPGAMSYTSSMFSDQVNHWSKNSG